MTLEDTDEEDLDGPTDDHLPTTSGARRWRTAARADQDDDRAAEQYIHAVDRLAADGWHAYEISNWSRTGHESRHNLAYWTRRPYEAVGPGAHAFDGRVRRWNAAGLDGYLAALASASPGIPRLPPGSEEALDAATAAAEVVVLGLRTDRGVAASLAAPGSPFADAFAWGASNGLVEPIAGGHIALTTRGRLLSNELFARLL